MNEVVTDWSYALAEFSCFFAFSRFSFPGNPSNVHIANVFLVWLYIGLTVQLCVFSIIAQILTRVQTALFLQGKATSRNYLDR